MINETENLENLENQLISEIEKYMSEVIYYLENDNLEKAAYNFNDLEIANFDLIDFWNNNDFGGFGYAYDFALGEGQHTVRNFLDYICETYNLDKDNFEELCEKQINY